MIEFRSLQYNLDFQGYGSRSSQNNMSPMNRSDTLDDSGGGGGTSSGMMDGRSSDGTMSTSGAAPGGNLNKPSNGQSASDPNI